MEVAANMPTTAVPVISVAVNAEAGASLGASAGLPGLSNTTASGPRTVRNGRAEADMRGILATETA
jgi:hypothetical protein